MIVEIQTRNISRRTGAGKNKTMKGTLLIEEVINIVVEVTANVNIQ